MDDRLLDIPRRVFVPLAEFHLNANQPLVRRGLYQEGVGPDVTPQLSPWKWALRGPLLKVALPTRNAALSSYKSLASSQTYIAIGDHIASMLMVLSANLVNARSVAFSSASVSRRSLATAVSFSSLAYEMTVPYPAIS